MLTQEMRSRIIKPLRPLGSTKSKSEYVVLMPNIQNWSYLNKACNDSVLQDHVEDKWWMAFEVGGAIYFLNPQN